MSRGREGMRTERGKGYKAKGRGEKEREGG